LDSKTQDLGTTLNLLRDGKKQIGVATVLGTVIAAAVAFLSPNWYEAQLSVVPTASKSGGLANALTADLPIDLNVGAGAGSADAERIQAVLKSRSVSDAVIAKFDLRSRYNERYLEAARKALWRHCQTKIDKKPAVVTLSCEDKDPQMAQAITAFFGDVGRDSFRRISTTSAGEERRFLEKRVAEAKHDVVMAAQTLRDFQETYHLVDLGEQSKAVVSAIASLKGELISKQLQLSYLSGFSSSDETTAVQLRKQIGIMEGRLKSMEDSNEDPPDIGSKTSGPLRKPSTPGLFPPAMRVPNLRFQLEQLYREVKVQETIFLLLTQRFEMARVNEARDTSAFQILDEAVTPTYKSRPKRSLFLAGGLLLGMLIGCTLALLRPRWRTMTAPASERLA
jgi:uncharacterized protein involved in exopolysaccharide biosynthesis